MEEVLVWLTYPPALTLILLVAAAVVYALCCRRAGVLLGVLGLGWSLLWSIPAYSDGLRGTLERSHRVIEPEHAPPADAIVVLGGGRLRRWTRWETIDPDEFSTSRLAAAAQLWHAGRAPVIVVSSGKIGWRGVAGAHTMAEILTKMGVPRAAIALEERSQDTRGNARMTAQWARAHGVREVLLVTSAVHMPRSELLFRRQGLAVLPFPVPERRSSTVAWYGRWLPSPRALWRSGRVLKEYAAIAALRAQQRFPAFPAG